MPRHPWEVLRSTLGYNRQKVTDLATGYIGCVRPLKAAEEARNTAVRMRCTTQDRFGLYGLRELLASEITARTGLRLGAANVLLVPDGTSDAMQTVLTAAADAPVFSFTPQWFGLKDILMQSGHAVPVHASMLSANGYQPDPGTLNETVLSSISALVLDSVCNPIGTVMSRTVANEIARRLLSCNAMPIVLEDHHYMFNMYSGQKVASVAAEAPELWHRSQVICAASLRLGYGLKDGVIGFVWASKPVLRCLALHLRTAGAAKLFPNEFAALQCFSDRGNRQNKQIIADTLANRAKLIEFCGTHPWFRLVAVPQSGTNAFVDISGCISARCSLAGCPVTTESTFIDAMFEVARVSLESGKEFAWNQTPAVRVGLAAANPADFSRALARIERVQGYLTH